MGGGFVAVPGNFDVGTQRFESRLVVAPSGEIDLATVGLVREAVDREHRVRETLVVDLREVGFMDTSGLRFLLELNERAGSEGFALRIVEGPPAVQRVFEVAGVEARLPFVSDPSEDPSASG